MPTDGAYSIGCHEQLYDDGINFNDVAPEDVNEGDYTYMWIFGDGEHSTERGPHHTYKMAGEYTAVRIRTYPDGSEDRNYFLIWVYDWDYIGDGIHVTYANKCIRNAITPQQGVSMVEWGGPSWLWPEAYVSVCNAFDKNNETVSIVLDTRIGQHFRIGQKEQWLDRLDNFGYAVGGYEIPCSFKLKEHISNQGEFQNIVHEESYIYLRPHDEKDRGLEGHNSETGFRDEFAVNTKLYKEGELEHTDKREKLPLKADCVFRKKIEARRIQLEIETEASGFRCIGVQQKVTELEKKPGAVLNTKSETVWQREFAQPDFWISRRSSEPLINRATGIVTAGTYDRLETGPDGYGNSAIAFNANSGLSMTLNNMSSSMLMFWLNEVFQDSVLWTFADGKRISIVGTQLRVNNGSENSDFNLDWDGTGWILVTIYFHNNQIKVYKNKRSLGTRNVNMGVYGGSSRFMNNVVGIAYDIRRFAGELSNDALDNYYDSVTQESGDTGYLPIWS